MKSVEAQLQEALEQIKGLTKENTELKEAVTKQRKETAKVERTSQLKESKLPEPCVKRLEEAFKESTDNAGLKEAINVETEYVKSLRGPATKHNGAGDNGQALSESEQNTAKVEEYRERQFNAYRAGGMNEADASRMSGFTPKK